jgi:Cu/Zn superoxide dismutase
MNVFPHSEILGTVYIRTHSGRLTTLERGADGNRSDELLRLDDEAVRQQHVAHLRDLQLVVHADEDDRLQFGGRR